MNVSLLLVQKEDLRRVGKLRRDRQSEYRGDDLTLLSTVSESAERSR